MYAKPRLPDPVRTAAVRAVIVAALTLVQLMVAFFCSMAAVWLAFPMVLSTIGSTVVATWAVLDVWITRQVWVQRHGVLSEPSSAARRRALADRHRSAGTVAERGGTGTPGVAPGVSRAGSVPHPTRHPAAEARARPAGHRAPAAGRAARPDRRTDPGRAGGTSVSR